MSMAMVVSPMIAPIVGGFLDARFGWRSIFWATLVLSLGVAMSAALFLRETAARGEKGSKGSLAAIVAGYPDLLGDRTFVGYTLALSFTTASFFAFIAAAPYIVVDVMGHAPDTYGFYFAVNAGGYMVGNFLSGRFGQRLGSGRLAVIGIYLSVLSMAAGVLCLFALPWTPATLFLPLILNAAGNGLTIPGGTAAALSVRPDLAGTAAGLLGATQLGFGAALSIVAGHYVTVWPPFLVFAMLACVLLAWASLALSARRRK
jgi:DHA1 family bicyclomycin/chloramphenicol resistance-like MFS transporter